MTLTSGRRMAAGLATALALVLAGFSLPTGPAQASPTRPLPQATITFPDGSETLPGSTLAVTFDAGGDRRVTGFRYGWTTPELDTAVDAGSRGGSATIGLGVGAITGQRQLYVAVVDGRGRVGPLNQATITVTSSPRLDGWVTDDGGRLLEGVTVTLEPGGLRTISDANGYYEFTGMSEGLYTVAASLGGDCPSAASQTLLIDRTGASFRLTLRQLDPDCVPEEEVVPADLTGVVVDDYTWQFVEGATVTLEPGGLQTTTDANGFFSFTGLDPGSYTVTATSAGGECGLTGFNSAFLDGTDQMADIYLRPVETCS